MAKKVKVSKELQGPIYDAEGNAIAVVPEKKPVYKKWWFWVLIVLALLLILSFNDCGSSSNDSSSGSSSETNRVEETTTVEQIVNNTEWTIDDLTVRQDENGVWCAFAGDTFAKGYNGLAKNNQGTWFITDGKVDFSKSNYLYTEGDYQYEIEGGKVVTEYILDANGDAKEVPKTTFVVGETFINNGKEIKFISANQNFTGYNRYATVPSGYKVLEVVFDFANNGTSDFYYSSGDLDCYADDEKCEKFYYVNGSASFLDTLSPGRTASNQKTYFLIPENANSIDLEYETNWWTENKVEFIVK